MKNTITTVNHSLGHWDVYVYAPKLTEQEYLALSLGHVKATSWTCKDFKTSGLALGWIKRLAKSSPDDGKIHQAYTEAHRTRAVYRVFHGSSAFNVIEWGSTWDIYFRNEGDE